MSLAVLADAQFSVARVFRPFRGFEAVYQGQPLAYPIAFPGDLDREAGKTGFDPNLISGISVPFGARIVIWVPNVFNIAGEDTLEVQPYDYELVWRVRNVRDFRTNRSAYHFPRQSLGESSQFVIPAAIQGLLYEGATETVATGPQSDLNSNMFARHSFVREKITFQSTIPVPPLTPSGSEASFQQGIETSFQGSNKSVTFNKVEFDAMGDELIILVTRRDLSLDMSGTWNFNSLQTDSGFSAVYGTANGTRDPIRDLGIYVFTGSNP